MNEAEWNKDEEIKEMAKKYLKDQTIIMYDEENGLPSETLSMKEFKEKHLIGYKTYVKIFCEGYEKGVYDKHADRESDIQHLSEINEELKTSVEKQKEINKEYVDLVYELQIKIDELERTVNESGRSTKNPVSAED